MATYKVKAYGKEYAVEVIEQSSGARVIVEGYSFEIEPAAPGSVPNRLQTGAAAKPAVAPAPAATTAAAPAAKKAKAAAAPAAAAPVAAAPKTGRGAVLAPIPGVITKVCVTVGEDVKSGQTVVKLEAMKMENDITSLIDGKVTEVGVTEGAEVSDGQMLVMVE